MTNERPTVIAVQVDGNIHTGSYTVKGRMITVSYGRSKTTQVGDTPLDALARLMMLELIEESNDPASV
jgi:hypothetical protein